MATVSFTGKLKDEYERLYKQCIIRRDKFNAVDNLCDKLLSHKNRYENVSEKVNIPWYFIAVIHNMESGQRFDRHLHNGDPLSARTYHVPKGRPKSGRPPFSWEESAVDALKMQRIDRVEEWSLGRLLYEIERYNGWGYRLFHPHVLSPYLWSWSSHYTSGKYVADGRWSDSAVSAQCGAAVLLRRLEERGEIAISSDIHTSETGNVTDIAEPIFKYSDEERAYIKELQEFLNGFSGIVLRVDGIPAEKTSNAVKRMFGFYLSGDPRNESGNQ